MSHRKFMIATFAAALTAAANAEPIDACSLLSEADMVELGLSKDAVPSRASQPGGVEACSYRLPSSGNASSGMASVILSQGVPERALQLRALQAKAQSENTPAQLQARGEYYEGNVMCKLVLASQQETSQCLGASDQSVVALAVTRPNLGSKVAFSAAQLRITAALVARVVSRGG